MKILPFNSFILERLSDELYHFCSVEAALSMLESDKFAFALAIGTGSDDRINRGKAYYMSFTRSHAGKLGYASTRGSRGLVRLRIDGEMLNAKTGGGPADYWGAPRDPGAQKYAGLHPQDRRDRMNADDEMEDRAMSDKPFVKGARRMILAVDVVVEHPDREATLLGWCNDLRDLCADYAIPFRFFDTRKAFDEDREPSVLPNEHGDDRRRSDDPRWTIENILAWCALAGMDVTQLAGDQAGRVQKRMDELRSRLSWGGDWMLSDYAASIEADLHNNKAYRNDRTTAVLATFVRAYRRSGAKNITNFIGTIRDRVRKIL